MFMAGAMDGWAAEKYAHFVDLCDAFNLPVVIFLDMPGFMLGSHAEKKSDHEERSQSFNSERRGRGAED